MSLLSLLYIRYPWEDANFFWNAYQFMSFEVTDYLFIIIRIAGPKALKVAYLLDMDMASPSVVDDTWYSSDLFPLTGENADSLPDDRLPARLNCGYRGVGKMQCWEGWFPVVKCLWLSPYNSFGQLIVFSCGSVIVNRFSCVLMYLSISWKLHQGASHQVPEAPILL